MACSSLTRTPLEDYVANANQVIYIKLINNEDDLHDLEKDSFHPEFTHQFFGDNENIFGYRNLKINLLYTGSKLASYIGLNYSDKINPSSSMPELKPDDVLKIITEKTEGHYYFNLNEFSALLQKESSFKPYGELIHSFTIDDKISNKSDDKMNNKGDGKINSKGDDKINSKGDDKINSKGDGKVNSKGDDKINNNGDDYLKKRTFEIYKSDMSNPGFRAYHERMQTFLLWFIDSASYIDADDDRWDYFVIYEKLSNISNSVQNGQVSSSSSYYFVGYSTVYRYYAYPQKIRPRISQFIIMPVYQNKGLGAELLSTIYNYYCQDSNVLDITVEDPSDNFIRLRDFVTARLCLDLESYQADRLRQSWHDDMLAQAREKYKINKTQARRVYEILRFRITNLSLKDQYKQFRIEVKKRLNAPFERQRIDQNKLLKSGVLTEAELRATQLPKDVRLEQLDTQYKQLEQEYRHIVQRLTSYS